MWIKICGLTEPAAVEAALAAGADALGFVFAPSVRRVQPRDAALLAAPARGRALLVAVTLQPQQSLVDEILRHFRPDALQGDWAALEGLRLPATLGRLPVLRAGGDGSSRRHSEALPARLLFEGPVSGSGRAADWSAAAHLARRAELVLAGGLHARNVAEAIGSVRPFGVDVSSGVEQAPGRKSPALIEQFIAAARTAARSAA